MYFETDENGIQQQTVRRSYAYCTSYTDMRSESSWALEARSSFREEFNKQCLYQDVLYFTAVLIFEAIPFVQNKLNEGEDTSSHIQIQY